MAKKQKPEPAPQPKSTRAKPQTSGASSDPQEAHEDHLKGDTDPGDASAGSEINALSEGQKPVHQEGHVEKEIEFSQDADDRMRVRLGEVGPKPCMMGNGHPINAGQVLNMHPNDVVRHRQAGIPLEIVDDDEECEVYDADIYNDVYEAPEKEDA